GYSAVERVATVPTDAAVRLLDARLTPLDPQLTAIASAFGGIARDSLQTATLRFDPGTAAHDISAQLTPISQQALRGRLPFGWSPVAAIDVGPADLALQKPAALTVQSSTALPPGAAPVLAFYDAAAHAWISLGAPDVSTDRLTYSFGVAHA